jgi:choline dehydrogenase
VTAPGGFDVVVLGGGTAGCVLAARLTEDPDRRVCLVEAGPDYGPFADGGWPAGALDHRHLDESHPWDPADPLMRARIIGGCSAHNAGYLTWGTERDYDEWADIAPGWGWRALAPFMDRARAELRARALEEAEIGPWARVAAAGAAEAGIPELGNLSEAGSVEGVGPCEVNVVGAVRWNTAFAYLDDARERPNLTVLDQALADRVLLDGTRARGARIERGGETFEVAAQLTVVAAGAYGSPPILLRSGIGPAAEVREAGVEPTVDLAGVGVNLQDHFGVTVAFRPGAELAAAITAEEGEGHMIRGGPIVKTASPRCEPGAWDLHHIGWSAPEDEARSSWRIQLSSYAMKPASRGCVRLAAADPRTPPAVDRGFISDPESRDLAVVVDGIGRVREIAASPSVAAAIDGETVPGPEASNRSALEDYVRAGVRGYFHPVGSCALGSDPDAGAVVDPGCRVHGTEGLVVCDASVMPTIPRANTNLTTVAIAEHVAAMLDQGGSDDGS